MRELSNKLLNRPIFLFIFLWLLIAFFSAIFTIHSAVNYQEVLNVSISHIKHASLKNWLSPDDPMPLYFLLIRFLNHSFSVDLIQLRWLSVFFFMVSIPAIYLLAMRVKNDRRIGLLASVLLAISPYGIWFSSRATMYSLLVLMAIINSYFFLGLILKKRGQLPAYLFSGLILIGVHYFAMILILSQLIFLLIKRTKLASGVFVKGLIAEVIIWLSFFAWFHFSSQNGAPWAKLPFTSKPSATNTFILFVEFLFGFQSVNVITLIIACWPLLVIIGLLAIQKYVRPDSSVQYLVFSSFLPVGLDFIYSWIGKPLFLSSYLIICLPFFIVLVSWYLVAFDLKVLNLTRNILITAMVVTLLVELFNPSRSVSQDYLGQTYQPAFSAKLSP